MPNATNGVAKNTVDTNDNEVLTLEAAAAYLKLTEIVVLNEAVAGRIPGRNIQGHWRFSRMVLNSWLSGNLSQWTRPLAGIGMNYSDEDPEEFIAEIYRQRREKPIKVKSKKKAKV